MPDTTGPVRPDSSLTAVVNDRNGVTWTPAPTKDCTFYDYARTALEAGAILCHARDSFALAMLQTGSPQAADYDVRTTFDAGWRKVEAKRIGDEAREITRHQQEDARFVADKIAEDDPTAEQRARLSKVLRQRGYETADARQRAADAVPDVASGTAADGEPWEPLALDNGAFAEPPKPLPAVGRGLLTFGRAVLSIVTHGKQGKTAACWADLAPVTAKGGRVLAIVGARELGPEGRAGYAHEIVGLGGDPRNVDILEPVEGVMDRLARCDLAARFAAVVIDSAASICEAEGLDENSKPDIDPLLNQIGAWGLAVVIVRHAVNSPNGQSGRASAASSGAGTRRWLAGVDGEAVLKRNGNRSTLTWVGRSNLPDVTAFELDKSTWPWTVTVLKGDDLPTPGGGGEPRGGVSDDDAEQTVIDVLDSTTEEQPYLMGKVRAAVATAKGTEMKGQAFTPYRNAIDRLYADGRIGADHDPQERKSGRRLSLWHLVLPKVAKGAKAGGETFGKNFGKKLVGPLGPTILPKVPKVPLPPPLAVTEKQKEAKVCDMPGSGNHLWEPVAAAGADDTVKHPPACPTCFGKGIDAFGRPCDRRQVVHSRATFRLGVPTFSARVGVLKAQINTSQSASP